MDFVLEYVMGEWVNIHIPEPVMWSYLEKEFTDVIKLRISGCEHPRLSGWVLNQRLVSLMETCKGKTRRGEGHVKMKAQIGVMQAQAKEGLDPQ